MNAALVLFSMTLVAVTAQAEPRQACVTCHREQAASQPETSMGHALETAAACGILRAHPRLTLRLGSYTYQIERQDDHSTYTVTDGKGTISVPMAWAFGLGAAGQTYVYEWKGNWYESRVSFYKQVGGLDLTMGALNSAPRSLEEAAGRLMSLKDAADCFNCHATDAIHGGRVQTDRLQAGVLCERCHGPSEKHLAAFKTGDIKDASMRKLGVLGTEEMSDFCGQCHRTWSQIAMQGPRNINNVRFQPYRLTNSKCYDSADGRIRCTACHDPHREVENSPMFYDAKCLACHGTQKTRPPAAKVCPTGSKSCVTCHMPKLELPGSHNRFSDHWIRVVRAGEAYPE